MERIIVTEKDIGRRLDEFLFSRSVAPSRSKVQNLIKENKVFVNNHIEKSHYILRLADVITYEKYTKKQLELKEENIPLDIIYEDDEILIVNKPAGLVVHPGNGHEDGTLANALIYHEKNLPQGEGSFRPGLVHRIDKDTSGLLAVAKTDKAELFLKDQLSDHSMHREYIALVDGIFEENDGKIDAPIGRDPKSPVKFCVNVSRGKEAITFFHVLKRYHENCSLISCRLLTGRTHQIRVHMDYIHHPVIGDPLYGKGNCVLYDSGQLLHAYQLTFKHPKTKEMVTFNAPLPKEFQDVLAKLHELK